MSWTTDGQVIDAQVNPLAVQKSKHSLLPVLVVLFLVSYGLMAMLVLEQGRTIDSQRNLIRSLFDDSSQLSHMKGDAFQKQRAEAQAQAAAKAHSQTKTPSTQATPQENGKSNRTAGKLRKSVPQRPPVGTADNWDERRIVSTI